MVALIAIATSFALCSGPEDAPGVTPAGLARTTTRTAANTETAKVREEIQVAEPTAEVAKPEIIKDDYDAALAAAREQGKKLLVNFTGHT